MANSIQGEGVVVLEATDGKPIWQHDFAIHPGHLLNISDGQLYLAETRIENRQEQLSLVACALRTGAVLWSYKLGNA